MAKLYFRYAAMGSGKSLDLLKTAFNYTERNQKVLLFTSNIDNRYDVGLIKSRLGVESPAISVDDKYNIYTNVKSMDEKISCVLVDEIQFFNEQHIWQLSDIVDKLNIPVICYGLRADFKCELFPSIKKLMAVADEIEELKTICDCGKKAIINSRYDENGRIEIDGNQIEVGDKQYKSICRKCDKNEIEKLNNEKQ